MIAIAEQAKMLLRIHAEEGGARDLDAIDVRCVPEMRFLRVRGSSTSQQATLDLLNQAVNSLTTTQFIPGPASSEATLVSTLKLARGPAIVDRRTPLWWRIVVGALCGICCAAIQFTGRNRKRHINP
jgi:hypothetical protein